MMRRRPAVMRRGPGLVRTVATTAVIAGTATAVNGAVRGHQDAKGQAAADEQAAEQQANANQADLEVMKQQMAVMQAQQVQASVAPEAAAVPTVPTVPAPDLLDQLERLTQLKTAGALTDAEFQAAKAKLLSAT